MIGTLVPLVYGNDKMALKSSLGELLLCFNGVSTREVEVQGGRMYSMARFRVAQITAYLLVLLLAAVPTYAANGRDFAGFYEIENVTEQGPTVRLTFSVRLFNYSGAKVSGATLTLRDRILPPQANGSFPLVSLGDRESVRCSAEVTISRFEYTRWQRGGVPNLFIEFQDSQGNLVRRRAELTQRPVGKEK